MELKTLYEPESSFLVKWLMEEKKLEKWQEYFCELTSVFACCVDKDGTPLTEFGKGTEEAKRVLKAVDKEQLQDMFLRVSESGLEDQAVETCGYPNLRLAVIAAKKKGRPVISWLLCGVISDASAPAEDYPRPLLTGFQTTVTEKGFDRAVDMIRDISADILQQGTLLFQAKEDKEKSRSNEKKLEANLMRMEKLMELIRISTEDAPLGEILKDILETIGKFLQLSGAAVCRILKNRDYMDIQAHWCGEKEEWPYQKDTRQKRPFFLRTEKMLILSGATPLKAEEKEELHALQIGSLIAFPITAARGALAYVYFSRKDREKSWQVEEIKFLNDSVKVLQGALHSPYKKVEQL